LIASLKGYIALLKDLLAFLKDLIAFLKDLAEDPKNPNLARIVRCLLGQLPSTLA